MISSEISNKITTEGLSKKSAIKKCLQIYIDAMRENSERKFSQKW